MQTQPARPPGIPSPPRTPSKHKRVPSLHTAPFTSPRRPSSPDTSARTREAVDTAIRLAGVETRENVNRDEVRWLVAEMHLAQKAYEMNKTTPPEILQAVHMLHRQEVLKWEKLGATPERHEVDNKPVNVVSWDAFHECQKALGSLEIVNSFGDLRCPHRHTGQQVRARIISSPIAHHQVMMYIEDIHGAALPLTLVFPSKTVSVTGMTDGMGKAIGPLEAYYKCLFNVGQNIAVREPFVKFGVQGEYTMQVDKINDIIVLLPSTSVGGDWRYPVPKAGQNIINAVEMDYNAASRKGRNDMEEKQYDRAIITFNTALSNPIITQSVLQRAPLLLERSLAFSFTFKRGQAYRDAVQAYTLFAAAQAHDNAARSLFIVAHVAHHLRLYATAAKLLASQMLQQAVLHFPTGLSLQIEQLRRKLVQRQSEAEHGRYKWRLMYDAVRSYRSNARLRGLDDEGNRNFSRRLDVADYTVPVTPKNVGRCGRGLVTTQDVKAGELLLVSKAVIMNWPADHTEKDRSDGEGSGQETNGEEAGGEGDGVPITFCLDHQSGTILPQLATQAVELLIHELDDNPAVGHIIAGLSYQGNPSSAKLPDFTLVKTEDEQATMILARGALRQKINITELHRIYKNNYFSGPMIHKEINKSSARPDPADRGKFAEMLFGLPSLVNHSCLPNASVTYWNDVVVFRATSDLPKGTEFLINYIPIGYSLPIRSQDLSQWDSLKCECLLCQADKEDLRDAHAHMTHIANEEHQRGVVTTNSLGLSVDPQAEDIKVETYRSMRDRLETRMEKARARGRREPMLDLASDWASLSLIVPHLDIMQVIDCRKQSLICAGFVFTDPVIHGHNRLIHSIVTGDDDMIFLMEAIAELYVRLHDFDEMERWVEAAQWVHNIHYGGGQWLFQERWSGFNSKMLLEKFGF